MRRPFHSLILVYGLRVPILCDQILSKYFFCSPLDVTYLENMSSYMQPKVLILCLTSLCGVIALCTVFSGDNLSDRVRYWEIESTAGDVIRRNAQGNTTKTVLRPTDAGLVFCNDTRLMPPETFPPVALASFPGSGNTWVRHLIETATGYATGSVYGSGILDKQGFIGEKVAPMSGRALTIKTHIFKDKMVGAILLVRNPYRALVAEYNRQKAGKTGHATEDTFKTPGWHKYVRTKAELWINLYQNYISHCRHSGNTCKSILIVYYEQLQAQLLDELRRILEYLSVSIDEERLACVLRNSEGVFHRPKKNGTWDPFSQEDRRLVNDSLKKYCDLIEQEGLESPPPSFTSYPGAF